MPMPNLSGRIQEIPHGLGLTPYGISQIIAAETDATKTERQAIEKRWQAWAKGRGLSRLQTLEDELRILGFALKLEKLP